MSGTATIEIPKLEFPALVAADSAKRAESLTAAGLIDRVECLLVEFPSMQLPVKHHWLPGLYGREILLVAGAVLTSEEHLTEHPFAVLSGRVAVASENEGTVIYEAGHVGVTKPHTRRILTALADCRWITWHTRADDETTPEQIADRILAKRVNPLLGGDHPRANSWRKPDLCPPVESFAGYGQQTLSNH